MKVKCAKLIDSKGNAQERSGWLTLGKVYHVLEVVQDTHGRWLLRMIGDGLSGVALFRLDQFEVVSAKLPDAWMVVWNSKGGFALTTEAWSQVGFWEAYYDKEPAALSKFEDGRRRIVGGDP
jgi:hypothetical protein